MGEPAEDTTRTVKAVRRKEIDCPGCGVAATLFIEFNHRAGRTFLCFTCIATAQRQTLRVMAHGGFVGD